MRTKTLGLWLSLAMTLLSSTSWANSASCPEASQAHGISYEILENCLMNDGVEMEVHGIVPMSSMFVVTYRNPKNFFQAVHLSLLGSTTALRNLIKTLKRHDVILVKGEYQKIPAPQKHIGAKDIKIIGRGSVMNDGDEHQYEALPAEVVAMKNFTGKVHAVFGDGRILVLEYKDLVVPFFIQDEWLERTKNLFRGDKVEVHYVVQQTPGRPVHLNLDPGHPAPLQVLHAVTEDHSRTKTLTGKLILFPKSAMVKFPVFAIDVDMGDGVMLPHTVLSFTDVDLFQKIRNLFQAAWDRHPEGVRNYRNKYINDSITVTVTGTYNMIDPLQANPQLVVEDLSDIVFAAE